MSGLKRADELLLRDLKSAVDSHGIDKLSEDDQLVYSLLNDRYDKFLDEGLKKLRGTPTQKRGLLSSIFNRGPQVPSSERRKARMSMANNNNNNGVSSPARATTPSDAPPSLTNDLVVDGGGLQMTNGSFFHTDSTNAAARTDSAGDQASKSTATISEAITPRRPPVDPTAWFASAVGDQEYLGRHWSWVLPNLVIGAIPFAAPTRDTPGHLSELNEQAQRRQSRITSVISCLGLDEPVGPDGFATAKDWDSMLSVHTFVTTPLPKDRDAVLVHYLDEEEGGGEGEEGHSSQQQVDLEGLTPIRKVTAETLTMFEDVLAVCKHITDRTTDPTTAEISTMVRAKTQDGNCTPGGGSVPTDSFAVAANSFASDGSGDHPHPFTTTSPVVIATANDDVGGASPDTEVLVGVVVNKGDMSEDSPCLHVDPASSGGALQASTLSLGGGGGGSGVQDVLSGTIVTPSPSPLAPPPSLASTMVVSPSSPSLSSPMQAVKRRLGATGGGVAAVVDNSQPARKPSMVGPRSVAYLHCKAGCGRSYIVGTSYLISQHGRTFEEADKYMRSMRAQFNPSEQQIAFVKAFEEFVSRPYVRPPSVEEERYQQVLADILSLSPEMRMRLLSDVDKLT